MKGTLNRTVDTSSLSKTNNCAVKSDLSTICKTPSLDRDCETVSNE